jgi:hypothetical protein
VLRMMTYVPASVKFTYLPNVTLRLLILGDFVPVCKLAKAKNPSCHTRNLMVSLSPNHAHEGQCHYRRNRGEEI